MSRRGRYRMVVGSVLAAALAGCGMDVTLTGSGGVLPGQTGTFTATITNVSACPTVSNDPNAGFYFLSYLPGFVIEGTPLAPFCGLGNTPPPALSSALVSSAEAPLATARAGLEQLASQSAVYTECRTSAGLCAPRFDTNIGLCQFQLDPGESTTITCTSTRPDVPGSLYSLAFAAANVDGVCKAGANQGEACDTDGDSRCSSGINSGDVCIDDSECPGGTCDKPPCSAGDCGDGICVGGTNAGNGCDIDSECPGGSCTLCRGVDQEPLTGYGIACAASAEAASAPALSPFGIAAALAGLGALAFWRLRRRA